MNTRIALICSALALSACASTTPQLDSRFGHAVNAAKAQQTLNPSASNNPDLVSGMDGRAAVHSIDRYGDSFKAPPPTFLIGIPGAAQ